MGAKDYLEEVGSSLSAFFICNATLRLTGEPWRRCTESVPSPKTVNKSPLHAAIDVVRLARTYYTARLGHELINFAKISLLYRGTSSTHSSPHLPSEKSLAKPKLS